MHPKEFKQEKAATGRLTHLCLQNSEIVMGIACDDCARVRELLDDPTKFPVLLYPGATAWNLSPSHGGGNEALPSTVAPRSDGAERLRIALSGRELVVFILDATWPLARKMLKLSPALQRLPRVMFTPATPSRYLIKQQPVAGCLSTLEAVHELLGALADAGLDSYADREQLLGLFDRMQQFQIACARDPARGGYRRSEYRLPAERKPLAGRSGQRRMRIFAQA